VITLTGEPAAEKAAYSPGDGRYLAIAWGDGAATVVDTKTWATVHTLAGHTRAIYSIAYSPDGRSLATSSTDRTVRVWDVSDTSAMTLTAQAVLSGHTHEVYNVAFSPDGKSLASASRDRTVRIWNLKTYTTTDVLLGHMGFVFGLAYSPDGKHLATSSADQTVRIWDMSRSPKTIAVLTGHTGSVTSLAYSPDGKFIASGSADQTVRRYLARFQDLWSLARQYVPRELTPQERFILLGEKP
jgi:WD40 repeat protein